MRRNRSTRPGSGLGRDGEAQDTPDPGMAKAAVSGAEPRSGVRGGLRGNPRTGRPVNMPASRTVRYRPATKLRGTVKPERPALYPGAPVR